MAINRVIIEGNLTRDVEMRVTASGLAVAGFTVAVNEKRKNAEGEYVDATVFVKCSLFGTRAEKLSKYLLKGTKVTIDGKLRYSQWVKDDEKRHELSIIVDQLEFSGGKILESYSLFDIYEGTQIKEGYKSIAYTLTFRAKDKTLEDVEITAAMKKILNGLEQLGIELRQ